MPRLNNSTITVKKEQLKCGCFDYNFSRGRCKQHTILDNIRKVDLKEVENSEGIRGFIEDADSLFSKWIRIKDADNNGMVPCFTCGTVKRWQDQHCGHYISRNCMLLRWDQRNARVQDEYCNCHKHGNLAEFGKRLELESPGITEYLYSESKIVYHITKEELKGIISDLTTKIKEIENKKK